MAACLAWPMGNTGLWVFREAASCPALQPIHRSLIRFCLCSAFPADCDSYCKASKGKLKINMKRYCKKDYGE